MKRTGIRVLRLPLILVITFGLFGCSDLSRLDILQGKFLTLPKLNEVTPVSTRRVQVVFNTDMETDGVAQLENYSITNSEDSTQNINILGIEVLQGSEGKIVYLDTDALIESAYLLTARNVQTKLGRPAPSQGISRKFPGSGDADTSLPQLIIPIDNHEVKTPDNEEIQLAWIARRGVFQYTVQVAVADESEDPFAHTGNHIDGSPFIIEGNEEEPPATNMTVSLPAGFSYLWQVTTEFNDLAEESPQPNAIHVYDQAIYVYCPANLTSCSNDGQSGTRSRPYRTIVQGMNKAFSFGFVEVRIAGRGEAAVYEEPLLIDEPVQLLGGYDPNFIERDRDAYPTRINSASTSTTVKIMPFEGDALLDGFYINNNSAISTTKLIDSDGCGPGVKIINNVLSDEVGGEGSLIFSLESCPLWVENNTIYDNANGESGAQGKVISLITPGAIFKNNLFFAQDPRSSMPTYAFMDMQKGEVIFFGNTIVPANADPDDFHIIRIYGDGFTPAHLYMLNNEFVFDSDNDDVIGIYQDDPIGIVDNTQFYLAGNIFSEAQATGTATAIFSDGRNIIRGNLLFTGNEFGINFASEDGSADRLENNLFLSSTTGYSLYESHSNGDPTHLLNNAFVSGGAVAYRDLDNGCTGNNDGDANNATCNLTDLAGLGDFSGGNADNIDGVSEAALFAYAPTTTVRTTDGTDGNADYDGNTTTLEVADASDCNLFVVGEYFEYLYDNIAHEITATECTVDMTVEFSPAVERDLGAEVLIHLWGSNDSNYHLRYALKTTSPGLGAGLSCSDSAYASQNSFTSLVAPMTSQAMCDNLFPHFETYYASSDCKHSYLPGYTELDDEQGNNNGICETGENCLFNPNIGPYPGHGNLLAVDDVYPGCQAAVDAALSGVTVFVYETQGY